MQLCVFMCKNNSSFVWPADKDFVFWLETKCTCIFHTCTYMRIIILWYFYFNIYIYIFLFWYLYIYIYIKVYQGFLFIYIYIPVSYSYSFFDTLHTCQMWPRIQTKPMYPAPFATGGTGLKFDSLLVNLTLKPLQWYTIYNVCLYCTTCIYMLSDATYENRFPVFF